MVTTLLVVAKILMDAKVIPKSLNPFSKAACAAASIPVETDGLRLPAYRSSFTGRMISCIQKVLLKRVGHTITWKDEYLRGVHLNIPGTETREENKDDETLRISISLDMEGKGKFARMAILTRLDLESNALFVRADVEKKDELTRNYMSRINLKNMVMCRYTTEITRQGVLIVTLHKNAILGEPISDDDLMRYIMVINAQSNQR